MTILDHGLAGIVSVFSNDFIAGEVFEALRAGGVELEVGLPVLSLRVIDR